MQTNIQSFSKTNKPRYSFDEWGERSKNDKRNKSKHDRSNRYNKRNWE
jgi:hypothetical protein